MLCSVCCARRQPPQKQLSQSQVCEVEQAATARFQWASALAMSRRRAVVALALLALVGDSLAQNITRRARSVLSEASTCPEGGLLKGASLLFAQTGCT